MDSILKTKLNIPLLRPGVVPRTRLIDKLKSGCRPGCRLILVSAPAGFGKTTLIAEWLAPRAKGTGTDGVAQGIKRETIQSSSPPLPSKVAWLALDPDDNEPARFVDYLVAALQTAAPGTGAGIAQWLDSPDVPSWEMVLAGLINELCTLPDHLAFVLDDYHVIDSRNVHQAMAYLVDHLPPQVHVIIATRSDPPLPLARWRARGEMVEIRAGDLRFTSTEAGEFLAETMGLSLSPTEIAELDARIEGWIAGWQMAALSLQGHPDRAAFIRDFGGSHRYVLEYLVEEVLAHQPEIVETFLLKTAVLERLSGPLCDAVLGEWTGALSPAGFASSQAVLEYLERANLFLASLDDAGEWFHYHHLFADLLKARLRRTDPDAAGRLLARAARWCSDNGQLHEAIEYALAARDFSSAADSIESLTRSVTFLGGKTLLMHWVNALPGDLVKQRPWLCGAKALALASAGQLEGIEPLLQTIGQSVPWAEMERAQQEHLAGIVAGVRALCAEKSGDLTRALQLVSQADEHLPANSPVRLFVMTMAGDVHYLNGDLARAEQAWRQVLQMARQTGHAEYEIRMLCAQARVLMWQGRLRAADDQYRSASQIAERIPFPTSLLARVKTGLGSLELERGRLDSATSFAEEGLRLYRLLDSDEAAFALVVQAQVALAGGDQAKAELALHHVEAIIGRSKVYVDLYGEWQRTRVQLWLAQGKVREALRWLGENKSHTAPPRLDYNGEIEQLLAATVWLTPGPHRTDDVLDRALGLLEPLALAAQAAGHIRTQIHCLILIGVGWRTRGQPDRAEAALKSARVLAEPEDVQRPFMEAGSLCPSARPALVTPAGPAADTNERAPSALVERLSERECEVLRLMVAGHSNEEIATELVVAVGTVKSHVHNIYGKLGVQRRAQAIARARELHLL